MAKGQAVRTIAELGRSLGYYSPHTPIIVRGVNGEIHSIEQVEGTDAVVTITISEDKRK